MFLAIDVGNTQTHFGCFQNGKLQHAWSRPTQKAQTSDEVAAFFLSLLHIEKLENKWEGVGICSVVPPVTSGLVHFSEKYLKCTPTVIGVCDHLGFALNVKEPLTVGADRLANVAYAVERLSLPAIVVDAGTATTLDAISAQGAYEGGAILPGVGLALECLSIRTAQLPLVEPRLPSKAIGKTTEECIQSGVLLGYADQLEGLIRRTAAELAPNGESVSIAVTGGSGHLFQPHLKRSALWDPHLTLTGILILSQRLKRLR